MTSFSSLNREVHCAPSGVLPTTGKLRVVDVFQDKGNCNHHFVFRIGSGATVQEALAEASEEQRERLRELEIEAEIKNEDLNNLGIFSIMDFLRPPFRHEIAVAIDPVNMTAREIGQGLERNYGPLSPTEIPGTQDVIGVVVHNGRRIAIVLDWKSAHDTTLPEAGLSYQMLAAGLSWALIAGVDEVWLIHVHWRDDGRPWIDGPAIKTLADLLPVASELESMLAKQAQARAIIEAGETLAVSPGCWCRYCPSVLSCPDAKRQWLQVSAPPEGAIQHYEVDIMARIASDPAGAREAIKRAESVVGAVKTQLALYSQQNGPITLADGSLYGPHEVERDEIDGAVAFEVARSMLGVEAAVAAVSMRGTKAGLDRAARVAGGKIAPTVRELYAEIGKRGGISKKVTTRIEEYRPRE